MKQEKIDKIYMKMAEQLSELSYAERKKVGSLIVKENQIISEGYNGTPSGFPNSCEQVAFERGEAGAVGVPTKTKREVLHAESNAITKLARSTNSSDGATLYVTMAPCYDCSKLIIQAGIKRVVYKNFYHDNGLFLLEKAKIPVISTYEYKEEEQ
tara:strand:+ start:310 stop:774 length:465 start_codon:yes stop_codon:yes gene_type:complete